MLHQNAHLESALKSVNDLFESTFQINATTNAIAPGRVNLIGEHVDYNDGLVMPFAIDRYTAFAGNVNSTRSIRLRSSKHHDVIEIDLQTELKPIAGSWTNYVVGVVKQFQKLGIDVPGFDATIHSNIPMGAGLSSSAAIEVASATFLEVICQAELKKSEKALICRAAENEFVGVPCGIMDQFASIYGQANKLLRIDCRDLDVEYVAPPNSDEYVFVVVNSHAPHQLVDGKYAERKQESASALNKSGKSSYRELGIEDIATANMTLMEAKRARHIVSEIERVKDVAALLASGDWTAVGELMFDSHASLRDDYEVSCVELDELVAIAAELGSTHGVIGSRMTGGGFGGCTISIVKRTHRDSFVEAVRGLYLEATGIDATIFTVTPSMGAHVC